MLSLDARDDLIKRLRRIEGQTQGIQRMLVDGRECREILNQLASVRAATRRASQELMRHYALSCLREEPPPAIHSPHDARRGLSRGTRAPRRFLRVPAFDRPRHEP